MSQRKAPCSRRWNSVNVTVTVGQMRRHSAATHSTHQSHSRTNADDRRHNAELPSLEEPDRRITNVVERRLLFNLNPRSTQSLYLSMHHDAEADSIDFEKGSVAHSSSVFEISDVSGGAKKKKKITVSSTH